MNPLMLRSRVDALFINFRSKVLATAARWDALQITYAEVVFQPLYSLSFAGVFFSNCLDFRAS